jgi:hypothetical protein
MFRKKIGILICILAAFVLASASMADSSLVEFYAYLLGIENLDDLYFNGRCWVAKGHVEGGDITFDVDGREIKAKFDFYFTTIYIKDRDPEQPPTHLEDSINYGTFAMYDEEGAFYGIFLGKGFSGGLWSTKAEGKWEGQKIRGEYTILSLPGAELFEAELNGWWKNFDD